MGFLVIVTSFEGSPLYFPLILCPKPDSKGQDVQIPIDLLIDIFDDKNKLPEHLKNMLKKKKMLTIIINKNINKTKKKNTY